mmetsp:Transcript_13915/g.13688  ORF Transcript_13915/g.13688 Transcript_13915/m.13688 type:complete len:136 (+) Transcript_13915:39-446(+)
MGKAKKTRKVAVAKKLINPNDTRLVKKTVGMEKQAKMKQDNKDIIVPRVSSAMFFQANNNLKPPYQVLVDTNFFNFSIQNKLDPMQALMDLLSGTADMLSGILSTAYFPRWTLIIGTPGIFLNLRLKSLSLVATI